MSLLITGFFPTALGLTDAGFFLNFLLRNWLIIIVNIWSYLHIQNKYELKENALMLRNLLYGIGTMNKNSVFQVQENFLWMKVLYYTWKDMRVNLRLIEL